MKALLVDIAWLLGGLIAAALSFQIARDPKTSWGKKLSIPLAVTIGLGLLYYTARTGKDPADELGCKLFFWEQNCVSKGPPQVASQKAPAPKTAVKATPPMTEGASLSWASLPDKDPHILKPVTRPSGPIDGDWWPTYQEPAPLIRSSDDETWNAWRKEYPGSCLILFKYYITFGRFGRHADEAIRILDTRERRRARVITKAPQHHGPYMERHAIWEINSATACSEMTSMQRKNSEKVCLKNSAELTGWTESGAISGINSDISEGKCICEAHFMNKGVQICRSRIEYTCLLEVHRDIDVERCAG